jgi:hypothetical protein
MLRFVTRGYIAGDTTPTLFTHWGYLWRKEYDGLERPAVAPVSAPPPPSRKQEFSPRVLEDDLEILTIIEAYIKARYS